MSSLLEKLHRFNPRNPHEERCREQFLAFVSAVPRCFDRELEFGHITASAWVVNSTGSEVLLLHHRKLNKWLQPGGHCDGDADVLGVARREVEEETGMRSLTPLSEEIFDLDIHRFPAQGEFPEHFHFDVRFAFAAPPDAVIRGNDESHAVRWVPVGRLREFTNERNLLRMADKWIAWKGPRGEGEECSPS